MKLDRIAVPAAVLAGILLAAAQYFVWVYAPIEATMGQVQKIFYTHLPLAWWALISFFGVFAASVAYLVTRRDRWDLLAGTFAEIGVLFSGLALITGSVWGRAAWNTWWTWDPRLSTTLVTWFVYTAYLVLRSAEIGGSGQRRIRAVVGIVAFLDVPLVFFSARMWRSIHPAVFASKGGGLEPEMWTTVLVCVAAWGTLFAALVLVRFSGLLQRERVSGLLAARRSFE